MAMGMRIDKAGMNDMPGGINHLCFRRCSYAKADRLDDAILDKHIRGFSTPRGGISQHGIADDDKAGFDFSHVAMLRSAHCLVGAFNAA